MNFLIVTHVCHKKSGSRYFAYGPYIREMNLWLKVPDRVIIVAPIINAKTPEAIDLAYNHGNIEFIKIPQFDVQSTASLLRTLVIFPVLIHRIAKGMRKADHIHLRCPGNVGLLGCFVQIFFPKKKKTAKYAGNWDPEMLKIKTYNWQRAILSNEKLSKNISVLVYGEWPGKTRNIKPFFTASYNENEIVDNPIRNLEGKIHCLYCGFLLKEKRPLQSIEAVERLYKIGYNVDLTLLGDGPEFKNLNDYIRENNLSSFIHIKGNVPVTEVKIYMQQSHFLTFYGHDSEGWPKVVAESMFWGCVPLVRAVSCTRFMVGNGERGTIVEDSVDSMVKAIVRYINDPVTYESTAEKAIVWSRQYTLERFEGEINKLLIN